MKYIRIIVAIVLDIIIIIFAAPYVAWSDYSHIIGWGMLSGSVAAIVIINHYALKLFSIRNSIYNYAVFSLILYIINMIITVHTILSDWPSIYDRNYFGLHQNYESYIIILSIVSYIFNGILKFRQTVVCKKRDFPVKVFWLMFSVLILAILIISLLWDSYLNKLILEHVLGMSRKFMVV